eukprot:gnl/TRDRNA2_/TRDRNA2_142569_c0_seq1.p1 gnl/TRDRNA2_/TRDRNA2_142569_c0~~gnl/TRDRNA2_/TRDRNA2_142569_c0_seq1.p1  ORF type:complete len:335 (-),score=61.63 gnl/TRDRNA2_/TRDRNA2_142569_c0_seq1:68-1030(-)
MAALRLDVAQPLLLDSQPWQCRRKVSVLITLLVGTVLTLLLLSSPPFRGGLVPEEDMRAVSQAFRMAVPLRSDSSMRRVAAGAASYSVRGWQSFDAASDSAMSVAAAAGERGARIRPGDFLWSSYGMAANQALWGRASGAAFPCRLLSAIDGSSDEESKDSDKELAEEDRLRRDFLEGKIKGTRSQSEAYVIQFTCEVCKERSAKKVSKRAYHHGVVIIACPSCQARHLISDHKGYFKDERTTVEDLMRDKGQPVKRIGLFRFACDADGKVPADALMEPEVPDAKERMDRLLGPETTGPETTALATLPPPTPPPIFFDVG